MRACLRAATLGLAGLCACVLCVPACARVCVRASVPTCGRVCVCVHAGGHIRVHTVMTLCATAWCCVFRSREIASFGSASGALQDLLPYSCSECMMPAADAGGWDDLSGGTVDDLLGGAGRGAGLFDHDFGLGGVAVGPRGRLFSGRDDIEVGLLEDREQHFGEFPSSSCSLDVGRALAEGLCLMFVAVCAQRRAAGPRMMPGT